MELYNYTFVINNQHWGKKMNETYLYRKHLREPLKFFLMIELILVLSLTIGYFGTIIALRVPITLTIFVVYVFALIGLSLMVALELVLIYFILYKRFKSISVLLKEEGLIYTNKNDTQIILYTDIEKLEFPSIKYMGGFMKIRYKGKTILITVVLENIGGLLVSLKSKLDENNMSHVYHEKKFNSFLKTAVFADDSWDRIYRNVKVQLLTHALCTVLTLIILTFNNLGALNLIVISASLIAPLMGYLLSELMFLINGRKRICLTPLLITPRNVQYETKLFRILIIGFSIAHLLITLIVSFLFNIL